MSNHRGRKHSLSDNNSLWQHKMTVSWNVWRIGFPFCFSTSTLPTRLLLLPFGVCGDTIKCTMTWFEETQLCFCNYIYLGSCANVVFSLKKKKKESRLKKCLSQCAAPTALNGMHHDEPYLLCKIGHIAEQLPWCWNAARTSSQLLQYPHHSNYSWLRPKHNTSFIGAAFGVFLEFYPGVFVESHFETISTPSSAGSDPREAL